MNMIRWSERLERFLWMFLRTCGSFPLQYVAGSPGRFSVSRRLVLYSIGITVAYVVSCPALMFALYQHERLASVYLVSMLNAAQLSFIYLFLIAVNVTMLTNVEKLCSTLNVLFAVRHEILQQWHCRVPVREYTGLLFYKFFIIDFVLLVFSLMMYYVAGDTSPSQVELAVGVIFSVFRYIITALLNFFLVGMMIVSLVQESINSKLSILATEQAVDGIEPTVQQVYMVHCQNAQLGKQYMAIMNLPVLLLIGWFFFMIVIAVYYIYSSTMLEVTRGLGLEDITKYINSVSFFLYLSVQLYYIMTVPWQYTERSKKMMSILGTINYQCREHRMECMLELITLDYMQQDYDVRNFGMYEINRALLFGTIATVTSYVIILVQFHMQAYG